MLDNFRFDCSWEKYVETVNIFSELLQAKKVDFIVGLKKDFDLIWYDANDIEEENLEIINEEITYLVYEFLKDGKLVQEDVKQYMIKQGVEEKEAEQCSRIILNKMEYACDALVNEELINRFRYKKELLLNKISDIKYNVCDFVFENNKHKRHCILKIETNQELSSFDGEKVTDFINRQGKGQSIEMVCDEADCDYLIRMLQRLKQRLQERGEE